MARKGDGIFKRGNVWRLDAIINRRRWQVQLGKGINRTTAQEIATAKRAAILKGDVGIIVKRKDVSFEKAAEEFLKWAEANKRPKTYTTYKSIVNRLKESFGNKMLSEIHPFLIEKYKQRRIAENAKVSVNRELSRLRTLFNLCLKWKHYEGENPVRSFQMAPETRGRVRFLTEAEEKKLLSKASEPLRSVIIIGIHTGLRMYSEGTTLTWENVDFNRKTITVEDHFAKNGETRTIPLNTIALATLRRLKSTTPGPWVFMTRGRRKDKDAPWRQYTSFRTAFETAVRNVKLSGVTPHTLRHTFASRLVMRGVDLRTVQELGGWKSLNMVQRYAHLSQAHKQDAVELLAKNSPSLITTVKKAKPVTPCAPIAQVDRASAF